jgi:hypothetical protein
MNQVSEIKCPHCGKWTEWNGQVDDKCPHCGGFLDPQLFSREEEKKIEKELKEKEYLFIRPEDGFIKRSFKRFLNFARWWTYFVPMIFFILITLIIVLISIISV